jgi:hypothetical protein
MTRAGTSGRTGDEVDDLNGRGSAVQRTGDWHCRCGQEYRVLATSDEVRMWPRNSNQGFAHRPIEGSCFCGAPISRGTVLSSLFGAVASGGDPAA